MTASARDLVRLRLASQLIAPAADGADVQATLEGVVHHMLAMQAQDFAQAVWALGVRVPGSTRSDVGAVLERGRVIRSWPMRGTLHFVEATDIRWMLRLTAERTLATAAKRHRDLGLDQPTFDRATDVAVRALSGGRRLGRDEMLAELEHGGIPTDGQRGVHIIGYLAQTAVVCWGPPHGTQQALVLLDEWSPERDRPERDAALRMFALRYFMSHGPATLKDFVWWSKLTVADAKTGLELAAHDLIRLVHDDVDYWLAPAVEDAAPARIGSAPHLLPGFDEYLMGYQNRSHSLEIEHAPRIVPGDNGVFLPMIVTRGRIVGTWRRAFGSGGVTVTAIPFERLGAREQAGVEREAKRYGRFHAVPTTVVYSEP